MSALRIAARIACPVPSCRAPIGLGCHDAKGRPCPTHAERLTRAQILVGEARPKTARRKSPRRPRKGPPPGPVVIRNLDGSIVRTVSQRSIRSKRSSAGETP